MKVQIVKGDPHPDENCLHCQLAIFYQDFVNKHGQPPGMDVVMDVSHFLGEMIGSGIYNSGRRHQIAKIVSMATAEIHRSASELLETMDRTRTS